MALTLESLKPIYPKYDYKYTDRPKEACATYLSGRNPFNLPPASCSEHKSEGERLTGEQFSGKVTDWRGKSHGLYFQHHPSGNVNVICVKLSDDCKTPVPVICRGRTRTRCTQTRYRESSAQTRPFQPDVAGDKENYKNFEVYQISKLLDGFYPPGEYEAKVVERARRRRQYEKALHLSIDDAEKHRTVLEAMEWEDWVAREEDIQGCQMLRMQIVNRMFEERENNFRTKSDQRIAFSSEQIETKRASQLKKINTEFARSMRRLEVKKQKINRNYQKGNITQEHIDPTSDLHAPQMRFGVNPNRRHFVGFRKNFDDRIDDLDKKRNGKGLASLICPFSKLRSWAKPKEQMKEVTQRFLSDDNLKNLYTSLKGLRTIAETTKPYPKCLKRKTKAIPPTDMDSLKENHVEIVVDRPQVEELQQLDQVDVNFQSGTTEEELTENLRQRRSKELSSKTAEEIASIVGEFEGTTLGSLIQFLHDELERLKQQKKFQAIHMLAEKERWKREAYEAGLRQKENKIREDHEKLFAKACEVHKDTASLFLQSVLEEEFEFTAETLATDKILELAKEIDNNDLESLKLHGKDRQIHERMVIRDYVRDQVFGVVEKRLKKIRTEKLHEAQLRAIEEELYASVERALQEEYQTPESVSVVSEILDELITDAVTYDFDIFTPEMSDNEFDVELEIDEIIDKFIKLAVRQPGKAVDFVDSVEYQNHLTARKEAEAILRKLIRRVIPEERWNTEGDRIVEQTLSETFNDAVYELECLKLSREVQNDDKLQTIISDIYRRMGGEKRSSCKDIEQTSGTSSSRDLKSIVSTIDIFDPCSGVSPDSRGSLSMSDDNEELHGLCDKIFYVDPENLKKHAPVALRRRHERYNIMGKVANRYQAEQSGDVELFVPEVSDDSNSSSQSSFQALVSCRSRHAGLIPSNMCLTKWEGNLHPELAADQRRSSISIRSNKRYQWASFCYDMTSGMTRKTEYRRRSSSF